MSELEPLVQRYDTRAESHRQRGLADPQLELYRWMLEELRVSLFAQQLGTSQTVSIKRLEKQWAKVAP
jgi:ATP-dependent helicase HrpA